MQINQISFKGLVKNLQYKKVNEILVTLFDTKLRSFFNFFVNVLPPRINEGGNSILIREFISMKKIDYDLFSRGAVATYMDTDECPALII